LVDGGENGKMIDWEADVNTKEEIENWEMSQILLVIDIINSV